MQIISNNLIQQSDIQSRLRLFRLGLLATSLVTLGLCLIYPQFALHKFGGLQWHELPSVKEYLPSTLLVTFGVTVILAIIYFIYAEILKATVGKWSTLGT